MIYHLCHGLLGSNNGLDIYIETFININLDQKIIVPAGTSNNQKLSKYVIEVNSLEEVPGILSPDDTLLIHWTGYEPFAAEKNNLIKFRGETLAKDAQLTIDRNPHAYINVSMMLDPDCRPNVIVITHSPDPVPAFYNFTCVDAYAHVSYKCAEVNRKIKARHFVIYPALRSDCVKFEKQSDPKVLTIGWLGRLCKLDPEVYRIFKKRFGGNQNIKFIFAGGDGAPDESAPDNFFFPGNLAPKDFWPQIDLFLYPSIYDSFGLVVLEAAAQGVPIFAGESVQELTRIVGGNVYATLESWERVCLFLLRYIEHSGDLSMLALSNNLNAFSTEVFEDNWVNLIGGLKK